MESKPIQKEFLTGLLNLAGLFVRHFRLIAGLVLLVMIITAAVLLLTPNRYLSRASILPSGKQDNLSTLRELTGIGASMFDIDESSSALFPEILTSDQVRDAVIKHKYSFSHESKNYSFDLKEFFGRDWPEQLRSSLGTITTINTNKKTGVITVTVETIYPALSQAILKQMLAELENYNANIRRSRAKETERYLKRELNNREKELETAEEKLEEFQNANRDWYTSTDPGILLTMGRLKRNLEINSQTYQLLREQYEVARLNVRRDVPVVRVLDPPSRPTIKSRPKRATTTLLAGIVAFILIFGALIVIDIFRRAETEGNRRSLENLGGDLVRSVPVVNRIFASRKRPPSSDIAVNDETPE